MPHVPTCVFPPCPRFGLAQGATAGPWCAHCGRPLRGSVFGPAPGFRIEAFLDDGYYAEVFAAVEVASGVRVAAKLYGAEPAKREAAAREATALSLLAQPRVPALRASFEPPPGPSSSWEVRGRAELARRGGDGWLAGDAARLPARRRGLRGTGGAGRAGLDPPRSPPEAISTA